MSQDPAPRCHVCSRSDQPEPEPEEEKEQDTAEFNLPLFLEKVGNITHDEWYCNYAADNLAAYAMGGVSGGYHCYEIVLAFAAVRDGTGLKDAGLNATALAKFKQLVIAGCGSQASHSAKVENHGIDAALQQAYVVVRCCALGRV